MFYVLIAILSVHGKPDFQALRVYDGNSKDQAVECYKDLKSSKHDLWRAYMKKSHVKVVELKCINSEDKVWYDKNQGVK